jgi:hypothetical protein
VEDNRLDNKTVEKDEQQRPTNAVEQQGRAKDLSQPTVKRAEAAAS